MEILRTNSPEIEILPVDGGHMFYDKCIVNDPDNGAIFIKAHNGALFTKPEAAAHTLAHLRKEGALYQVLKNAGYGHLPDISSYDAENDILFLTAHTQENGWHWELPTDTSMQPQYVEDVLTALSELENIPASVLPTESRLPSLDEIYKEGWQKLVDEEVRQKALTKLVEHGSQFHEHVVTGIHKIEDMLDSSKLFSEIVRDYLTEERPVVGHFDARQSNMVWHPDHGAKLVDWSWASPAPLKGDKTMFVIDIFKSGYDVSELVENNFDPRYALLQIGHWLARSTNPPPKGDETVRFHQLTSAVSAATLL